MFGRSIELNKTLYVRGKFNMCIQKKNLSYRPRIDATSEVYFDCES
jgi:hypothetical protein